MVKVLLIVIVSFAGISNVVPQNKNKNLNQEPGISPEVEEIIENSSDSEVDTGTVIFLREAQMIVGEGGLFEVSYHIIGKIYDEKAKDDYSQIPLMFNSYYEEVTLDYARTIDTNKTFVEVSKDAVQIKTLPDYYGQNTYTDSKILTFSLPALKPGKWFEYQVTYKTKQPVINNYWFETYSFNNILRSLKDPYFIRIDPVEVSRFILIVKKSELFRSEIINTEISEEVITENGNKKYIWEMEDVPTFTLELYMPYLYEEIPVLTISSIPDWKSFGEWVYSTTNQSANVSEQIKKLAFELTANANTENEKIKILYDFVRNEIDYIQADLERGGLIPHSCDDVLRNKYGDCKDQSILLIALLKAINIEAYPALINTYSYKALQKFLPTQYFDHMIVYVPVDSSDLWLDPTTEFDNFPNLYSTDQNRWALVIDENDSRFIRTSSASMQDNCGIFQLATSPIGDTLKAIIKVESFGIFNDYISSFMEYYSNSERNQYFKEVVESYYYQVAEVEESKSRDEELNDKNHEQIISIKLIQPTNEYTLFDYQSAIHLAFTFFYLTLPIEEERQFDLVFPFKFVIKGDELFKSPWEHAIIKTIPLNDSISNKYFSYKHIFEQYNDSVRVIWEFALKENFIPKEDYGSFYTDISEFEDMLDWKINFQKQLGFTDLTSTFSDYFGINVDSTLKQVEFIPPRYLNDLNIQPSVKQEIVAVIETYISALNDDDEDLALELLTKDNPESKYVRRYWNKISKSSGFSMKVENINVLDVMYDYAIVTYTTLLDIEKNQEVGQIRLDYLSILDKSDHHWKIYRSRVKNFVDICTVYSIIAYSYYNNKKYDRALVIYDLAMANDSTCTGAIGNTGWIYYLKGNYNKCIEFSEKAIELDSTALYAHYNIALSYLCLGEIEKSKLKYQQTIELNEELGEKIHPGAIKDLEDLIQKNIRKAEAENILTELFEVKNIYKSGPAEAK
jgi:transglutaminase-like putative cysteine protease